MEFAFYLFFLGIFSLFILNFIPFIKKSIIYSQLLRFFYNFYMVTFNLTIIFIFYKFIFSDYSQALVYWNTHELDNLIYKTFALWSNNEGALMLWLWILSIYIYIFIQVYSKLINKNIFNYILKFLIGFLFILNFLIFVIFNPFRKNYWYSLEGFEFNILLQDPLFVIHPPILFFGYLGYVLVYGIAFACIQNANLKNAIIYKNIINKLNLIAWFFLTLGIFLGSWWAYYELGWEGWWSWDPVENLSLIPWIISLALVHSLKYEYNESFRSSFYTQFFSLISLPACLIAMFFVRSGFLDSVHAFVNDYSSGFIFLSFILFFLILAIIKISQNLAIRNLYLIKLTSRKGYLFLVINAFLIVLTIIALGTFFPVLFELVYGNTLSLSGDFFNNALKIIGIPFFFIFILNNITVGKIIYIDNSKKLFFLFFLLGYISSLHFYFNIKEVSFLILSGLTLIGIFTSFMQYYKLNNTKMFLGHLSFCLVILGILIANAFKNDLYLNLNQIELFNLDGLNLIFRGFDILKRPTYTSFFANIILSTNLENLEYYTIFPEQSFSFFSNTFITKSVILSNFFTDYYFTVFEDSLTTLCHITKNPLVSLIWLGAFGLTFTIFVNFWWNSFLNKNNWW